jgi:fermentation-respiration switch protein FrsA (DUF1100 family)
MRNAIVFLLSAVLLFAAGSSWIALYPTIPADLGGVVNLDSRAERVRIPVGEDDHLDGWYLRGTQPATVILFAGYARDHRREWRYAQFLHKLGVSIVTVDFRSARALRRRPTTLGFFELRDARATLDWVRARPESRGHRVALFGESLGGAAALALAAERPDVDAVIADCPFASGDAALADGFRFVVHVPAYPLAPIARQLARLITTHDPGALDVTQSLRALNGRPVLLIQTRMEDRFSREQVERLTTAAGLGTELWTVDDAKHTEIWVQYRDEYEKKVSRFVRLHLGIAPPPAPGKPKLGERVVRGAKAAGRAVTKPLRKQGGS